VTQPMDRAAELKLHLGRRILILDGSMGFMLQAQGLRASDFGGESFEGCNEQLNVSKPSAVSSVHEAYLEAGADILESNTFGAVRHILAEYGLADRTLELARAGMRLAAEAARRCSTPDKPRFAAGALGPGTKSISLLNAIGFAEVRRNYAESCLGLLEGGADLIVLETQQDTLNTKASMLGILDAFDQAGRSLPVAVSASLEPSGTLLAGQTVEALAVALDHFDLLALGLNCSMGPRAWADHLRTLSAISRFPTLFYPNAGLPDEHGRYDEPPQSFARAAAGFAAQGWLNMAGGCCGTTPAHISELSRALAGAAPRVPPAVRRAALSGLEPQFFEADRRPVLIGERTNVIGSKKFRDLVATGDFEAAAEVGRAQARGGGQVLDICLANPDRDEKADMSRLLEILRGKVKTPFMIDSTDPDVVEAALQRTPGKCVVNSVNLEDGGERIAEVAPLLRRYGAAVVVGMIDEDKTAGMAVTRGRKLEIARRSVALLTGKYGLPVEDLFLDALVFPCASGDQHYRGSAAETIEAIRLFKAEFPRAMTTLGISNVSFGLPKAGREVLNAVFLHRCVEAGLDSAIVNPQGLARYATLPEAERKLAEDLLLAAGPESDAAIAQFVAHFRTKSPLAAGPRDKAKLPPKERLRLSIIEGSKEGLEETLAELLPEARPLDLVNGPLMEGMAEVGRLFSEGKLIVAEVLGSAEVMKAAVTFLEPKMDPGSSVSKGRVLLATVKGDVHDIGKNLVHIILKNNGFEVTDLGIKVESQALAEAAKASRPDLIGLSGLLVKSAHQMAATAEDLRAAGVRTPILVGGAALSAKFTASRIAPSYDGPVLHAKDAMAGLDLANRLVDPARSAGLVEDNRREQERLRAEVSSAAPRSKEAPAAPALIRHGEIPVPPDFERHLLSDADLAEVFRYLDPAMLYGKHLGLKGDMAELLSRGDPKAVELHGKVAALKKELLSKRLLTARAVYRFFAAQGDGDDLVLFADPSEPREAARFSFPRQAGGERLCLADFASPKASGKMDYVALFVASCGAGVRGLSERLREDGRLFDSHAVQALAIEAAEGLAELVHERLRALWGFPDPAGMPLRRKLQAKYRGRRVSPGYASCPSLEDQALIWRLLRPDEAIGVSLTEGFMMDPEASVSAIVFHHPQTRHFSADRTLS